jgi:tetratricopeptide (TPR) repeat protein
LLGEVGRCREALALAEEAKSQDPQNPLAIHLWLYMLAERYEEQTAGYDTARAKWPAYPPFTVAAAMIAAVNHDWPRYEMMRRHAYAQSFLDSAAPLLREAFRFLDAIRDGDQAELDRIVQSWTSQIERTGSVFLTAFSRMGYAGRVDAAFQAVERARFDGVFELGGAPVSNDWWASALFQRGFSRALRDDPRYLRLCAKLGLVHYWLETGRWPDCADEVPYDFRAEARKVAAEGLARHV